MSAARGCGRKHSGLYCLFNKPVYIAHPSPFCTVAARASRVIYLMDGNIHDELILGTYTGSDSEHSNHEKALFQWLEKHGF